MADTIDIKWLKDKDGNKFYPRTNTNAVTNDEGENLAALLAKLRRELKTDAEIEAMIANETWEQDVVYYTVEE